MFKVRKCKKRCPAGKKLSPDRRSYVDINADCVAPGKMAVTPQTKKKRMDNQAVPQAPKKAVPLFVTPRRVGFDRDTFHTHKNDPTVGVCQSTASTNRCRARNALKEVMLKI